jgi:hypothetical protein
MPLESIFRRRGDTPAGGSNLVTLFVFTSTMPMLWWSFALNWANQTLPFWSTAMP